jgi:putative addiction module component (TIGR02574 family)
MAPTVEKVASDALALPSASRAELVEKLLASLAGEPASAVTRDHLAEIHRRRADVRSGRAQLIDGEAALLRARAELRS